MKPSPPGKGRLRLLTLDELEALPDPEWLIEGTLPQGGLAVLYGEPGAGKSFLALDWALSIAENRPWLGRQVRSGTVIYVYAEGASGLKYRVRAWIKARGRARGDIRFLPHSLDLRDHSEVAKLVKAIGSLDGDPRLIVIDTLARCFGAGDENTPKDMNAFVRGADGLRLAFPKATVVVVHHSGKDPTKGDRGHSALRAAADTIMWLAKVKNYLKLQCMKQKDAEEFKSVFLRLQKIDVGKGRTSCVIEETDAKSLPNVASPRATETDTKALEALTTFGTTGATYKQWLEASGLSNSTFKDARGRLLNRGEVVQNGPRYVRAYLGPEAGTGPEVAGSAAA